MAKRTWIKAKRGVLKPRHQTAIGEAIWLYLYLLDNTDWKTGVVSDYTDAQAAVDLGIPKETIRKQRYRLQKANYIDCAKTRHKQFIMIGKWSNPHKYDGTVINDPPDMGAYLDAIKSGIGWPLCKNIDSESGHESGHESNHETIADVTTLPLISESQPHSQLDSLDILWDSVRYVIKQTWPKMGQSVKQRIDATKLLSFENEHAIILCLMGDDQKEWLMDRLAKQIKRELAASANLPVNDVQFVTSDEVKNETKQE